MKRIVFSLFTVIAIICTINVFAQKVINAGVGGNNTKNLLSRIDTSVLNKHPDLVILMVGTNDFLNSKKMISYQQYEDNLNLIITKIKDNGAQVLLLTSPPVDSVYLFERHEKRLFLEAPNIKMDTARHIVLRLAQQHQTKSIDLFQKFADMGLPKHNEDLYFRNQLNSKVKDGVHPTALGYQLIAETVFRYLQINKLINKDAKIICFGDSITLGAGAGIGKSYPAVLLKLIKENYKN